MITRNIREYTEQERRPAEENHKKELESALLEARLTKRRRRFLL